MVESVLFRSQLRLLLDNGTDPKTGDVVTKAKLFNNVASNATPDQLYAVAHALVALQTLPLYELHRVDTSDLIEED